MIIYFLDHSTKEEFRVRWDSPGLKAGDVVASTYVPPGQSRVVKLARPEGAATADRVVLEGDDHAFDNTWYVAPPRKEKLTVLYFGDDEAGDANGQRRIEPDQRNQHEIGDEHGVQRPRHPKAEKADDRECGADRQRAWRKQHAAHALPRNTEEVPEQHERRGDERDNEERSHSQAVGASILSRMALSA